PEPIDLVAQTAVLGLELRHALVCRRRRLAGGPSRRLALRRGALARRLRFLARRSACLPLGHARLRALSGLHVERLWSLLTRPRLELDLLTLTKLLELDARAETRAMEEDV